MVTSGEQRYDGSGSASIWQEEEEVATVVYGKHTMVRLQMRMQKSKQVGQSGSKNAAKFVVGNQTKCPSWYLYRTVRHRPPSPAPKEPKKSCRIPIALVSAHGGCIW
jgi:hypothetical protein